MNRDILDRVKRSTVALGVVDNSNNVLAVAGSGFLLEEGLIMTADHVLDGCKSVVENYRLKGTETQVSAFFGISDAKKIKLNILHSNKEYASFVTGESYTGPSYLDVAIIIPKEQRKVIFDSGAKFLKIKNPQWRIEIYKEIAMCGYPSGFQSLHFSRELGMRFTPIMQFGRITGLMPFDEADHPVSIQTDIIGTGGLSGSPIIDIEDGEVVAITQNVLTATIHGSTQKIDVGINISPIPVLGQATIGLAYGVCFNTFYGFPGMVTQNYTKGLPFSSTPIKVSGLFFGFNSKRPENGPS